MNFDTQKPVKIFTGNNCIAENSGVFASLGKRAMIVSGKTSADKCGAMTDVACALEKEGIMYTRFVGVPENPPATLCHEVGAITREEGCGFVIGIGGGSAIDAAKAIAAYAANPQCGVMDIFDDSIRTNSDLPLVAIPTTSGTGSEACRYSVLTIDGGLRKKTYKHAGSYAKYSFVCPRYTSTMNRTYTVSTALDAFAHAMESYFSPNSCERSEEAALYAAKEIWEVLFLEKPDEFTSVHREKLAYAATAAGIAIDYTGTGFPHPLGYSLTLTRGTPHGAACAIFEGEFLRYNMLTEEGEKRAHKLAEALGTTVHEMIVRIPELSGVKLTIDADEREELIDRVAGAANYANSQYVISRKEMSDIYEKLFGA